MSTNGAGVMGTQAHFVTVNRDSMSWSELKKNVNETLIHNVDTLLGTTDHYYAVAEEVIKEYGLTETPRELYEAFQEAQFNNDYPTMDEYAESFKDHTGYKEVYKVLYMGAYQLATPFIAAVASNIYGNTAEVEFTQTQMHRVLGHLYRHTDGEKLFMLEEANRLFFSMSINEIKRLAGSVLHSTILTLALSKSVGQDKLRELMEQPDGIENALKAVGIDTTNSSPLEEIFPIANKLGVDVGAFYNINKSIEPDHMKRHDNIEEMRKSSRNNEE